MGIDTLTAEQSDHAAIVQREMTMLIADLARRGVDATAMTAGLHAGCAAFAERMAGHALAPCEGARP